MSSIVSRQAANGSRSPCSTDKRKAVESATPSPLGEKITGSAVSSNWYADAANVVGDVLSDPVYAPEQPSRLRASRVSFMPGGRTNWHKHAVGQILYVLSGVGRYQLEGEPVQAIRPGDTVVIPPNARHWHGAAPDTMMVHLAMSETNDKGEATSWFEPVSDADYTKSPAKGD